MPKPWSSSAASVTPLAPFSTLNMDGLSCAKSEGCVKCPSYAIALITDALLVGFGMYLLCSFLYVLLLPQSSREGSGRAITLGSSMVGGSHAATGSSTLARRRQTGQRNSPRCGRARPSPSKLSCMATRRSRPSM